MSALMVRQRPLPHAGLPVLSAAHTQEPPGAGAGAGPAARSWAAGAGRGQQRGRGDGKGGVWAPADDKTGRRHPRCCR